MVFLSWWNYFNSGLTGPNNTIYIYICVSVCGGVFVYVCMYVCFEFLKNTRKGDNFGGFFFISYKVSKKF